MGARVVHPLWMIIEFRLSLLKHPIWLRLAKKLCRFEISSPGPFNCLFLEMVAKSSRSIAVDFSRHSSLSLPERH